MIRRGLNVFQGQDSAANYEGVEWDSFEMEEDSKSEEEPDSKDVHRCHSPAASSPIQQQQQHADSSINSNKPAGSIGKLKISSEMRAKLELVTIGQVDSGPSSKETSSPNVPKLEDNRRLMLQQQLGTFNSSNSILVKILIIITDFSSLKGGRKWDSVQEVERVTMRALSEERTDLIKAVQRPQVNFVNSNYDRDE